MHPVIQSKQTVVKLIAEYGCRHLDDGIMKELQGNADMAELTLLDLSPLNTKQLFIMFVVSQEKKEKFGEAIELLNSLHSQAKEYDCLDIYLRFSLGLRIKDVINSVSMPVIKYNEKVHSLITEKYILPKEELKEIFSLKELHGFKNAMADIFDYFTNVRHNKREMKALKEHVCKDFTGSLVQVGRLLFERIQMKQPLSALEQLIQAGELSSLFTEPEKHINHLIGKDTAVSDIVHILLTDLRNNSTTNDVQMMKKSIPIIPSSQLEVEEINMKTESASNLETPSITQFAKPAEVKSCLVLLQRFASHRV
ncbi:hypothetical protein BgiBS90_031652 [Biomphalaria glabrata]|nr:hypothetical protein BgiBS90_031652 [Biomphalaria glabrata]